MTLSTLKTMNLPLADLADSLKLRTPEPAPEPEPEPEPAPSPAARSTPRKATSKPAAPPPPPAGVVDPMQLWGALTKQFTELASSVMKDTTADAAKNLAGAVVKQSMGAATKTLKKAVGAPRRRKA